VPERVETINTLVAVEARDLLPETWTALANASAFGPAALERRHNRVLNRIFGEVPDETAQEALEAIDGRIIEYAGKRLAHALLDPGIEYWSRQALSFSIAEREAKAYKDRAEDLRQLKKDWLVDLVQLEEEIDALLPVRPGPAKDYPRVANVGDTFQHLTADPFSIPPAYGPPEG
jgi:hypothetical protein